MTILGQSQLLSLHRTFKSITDEELKTDSQRDWDDTYLRTQIGTPWNEILNDRLVVIVGGGGLGKTAEFKLQVNHLITQENAAFRINLDQVDGNIDLSILIEPNIGSKTGITIDKWFKESDKRGYFFLDSVDEAVLNLGIPRFKNALLSIVQYLKPYLHRVQFVLSSRATDWGSSDIRECVSNTLLRSLQGAINDGRQTKKNSDNPHNAPLQLECKSYRLLPLSDNDINALANHFCVQSLI